LEELEGLEMDADAEPMIFFSVRLIGGINSVDSPQLPSLFYSRSIKQIQTAEGERNRGVLSSGPGSESFSKNPLCLSVLL
jgi:hypothetical protein